MRKGIEQPLEPMIADSEGRLQPIDYLRELATRLSIVQNAIRQTEEREGVQLSFVDRDWRAIEGPKDALYDICNSG